MEVLPWRCCHGGMDHGAVSKTPLSPPQDTQGEIAMGLASAIATQALLQAHPHEEWGLDAREQQEQGCPITEWSSPTSNYHQQVQGPGLYPELRRETAAPVRA